jgi:hypothetical protein
MIFNMINLWSNKERSGTMKEIVERIVSLLDSIDLRTNNYLSMPEELNITEEELKQIYDSIDKTTVTEMPGAYIKSGSIKITSAKGLDYSFSARYSIAKDRTCAWEEVRIWRAPPSYLTISYAYHESYEAPSITDDAQTIAKRIISRLDEDESAERWTLGGSLEAEAKALFELIPRKPYHPGNTSDKRGDLSISGDDGRQYGFIAEESSDCGGSEWRDSESLRIECPEIGLSRILYDYTEYSR